MLYKPRTKPKELTILELLNKRIGLTSKDKQHYVSLKKGYEGEIKFDSLTEKLQCECLILNGLLFEVSNTSFQIDTLIIMQDKIHLYEVKNLEGEYYYENGKLYKKPRYEILDPLDQLSRSGSLLRQLFHNLGSKPQIDPSVVFIHPEFTLYQAPMDKPIMLPTQVKSYIKYLDTIPSKLTMRHKKLADQLVALHQTDSRHSKLPIYEYDQLKKGITCSQCQSFSVSVYKRKCVCHKCGYQKSVAKAVIRTVKEFQILFPEKRITTNIIHDWCKVVESKKQIRRVLAANFNAVGEKQWTYYE